MWLHRLKRIIKKISVRLKQKNEIVMPETTQEIGAHLLDRKQNQDLCIWKSWCL